MSIQINRLTTYRALFLALTLSTPVALLAENPSNPLAKSVNTDIRAQYLDLRDDSDLTDYFVDGGFMATEKLKVKYELHYWDTNVTGSSEQDWESVHLKGIYFPTSGKWGNTSYRTAVGFPLQLKFSLDGCSIRALASISKPWLE